MALHTTPQQHDENPPSTWTVRKVADRTWHLESEGATLDTFTTRAGAEQAKESGWLVKLYNDEGRWFAGLPVAGWKKYAASA